MPSSPSLINPAADPAAPSAWMRRLTSGGAAAAVLLIFYLTLLASLAEKSATFDEPGHATAGYVYWKFGDYRIDPENGNLSKRWIALPFLFRGDRFPAADAPGWRDGSSWLLADGWFNHSDNDTAGMLAAGRAVAGLTALALGAVVWFWSRRLFGRLGAMISLLTCVLSPIVLANGGLMTSDTPAALGFLLSMGCIWATLHHVTVGRILATAVAVTGLFLAKMSAVLLLPMAAILVAARLVDGAPLALGRTRTITGRLQQLAVFFWIAVAETALVVVLVWAAYGFRFAAGPSTATTRFAQPWEWALGLPRPAEMLTQVGLSAEQQARLKPIYAAWGGANAEWNHETHAGVDFVRKNILSPSQADRLVTLQSAPPTALIPRIIYTFRENRLLPESFLFGYAHVWKRSDRLIAYLNGEIRDTGWVKFFPFVFAVKTPLPSVALLVLALIVLFRSASNSRRALLYGLLPLLALFGCYWAAALASNLNIGHRHLLPVYPPLFILAGAVALPLAASAASPATPRSSPRWLRWLAPVLLVVLGLEVAYRFPNYIAYFNGLVRPARAYRHLIDSSLDWGQELPAIARYLSARPGEKTHLAYFGVGRPAAHGITAQFIGGFPATDWNRHSPVRVLRNTSVEAVRAFLTQNPDFDPDAVFPLQSRDGQSALVLQRGVHLQLHPGLYLISASLLPPVYHGTLGRTWTAAQERDYQTLRRVLQPLLSDDRELRRATIPQRTSDEWRRLLGMFYDLRLSRLTTFLRQREPDDLINASVLVYRLSASDLAQALDGPVPTD